ncbi:UL34 protein [Suid alphaherpesvirus 1]|nr:UL34 protein [Suid alphaherpesvirus 1]
MSGTLIQRLKLILSGGNLRCSDGETACDPERPPTRCVFQVHGQDGSNDTFPLEYVLRLMRSWAHVPCDPYVRVQNTGVSVLFQGFFFRPADAPLAAITAEHNNVILASTHSTGMSLSALDDIKRAGGVDMRPLRAMMSVSCFVRMPRVQLSFRFMGPDDASQMQRLLDRAELRQRSVSRPGGGDDGCSGEGPSPRAPIRPPVLSPVPGHAAAALVGQAAYPPPARFPASLLHALLGLRRLAGYAVACVTGALAIVIILNMR